MRSFYALALLAVLIAASPAGSKEIGGPTVILQEGRLSVSAVNAPLDQILAEISRLSGIRISVDGQVAPGETITVAFDALPLDEGLGRLLRGKNYVLVYSPSGLAEMGVYAEGSADSRPVAAAVPRPSTRARARARGDRPQKAPETAPAELARAQAEALEHRDPRKRIAALDKLALARDRALGLETGLKVLASEGEPKVLEAAMDLLIRIREPVALDPILKMAAHPDPALRRRALVLLDKNGKGDPRVTDALTTLAGNDQDQTIREAAGLLLKGPRTR
jgi:hypothetical protein